MTRRIDERGLRACSLMVVDEGERARSVYADMLSQAITGERVGELNYTAMIPLCRTDAEESEARAHAESEGHHAAAFRALARGLGVPVIEDPGARHWSRVRDAFTRAAEAGDRVACLVVQELMLESFAVALYQWAAEVPEPRMARTFAAVAREEEEHLAHAIEALRPELLRDRDGFEALVERLHREVVTVLAEMAAPRDSQGSCGLCADSCLKESLDCVGLEARTLRGRALQRYLLSLDELGVRGEKSLRWIANLIA